METAAVSELKASLSKFLTKVKAGEEVLVTERGRPIAKLVPLDREKLELPGHLLALERAGLVRVGTGRIPDDFWDLKRPRDAKGRAVDALLREREEGG